MRLGATRRDAKADRRRDPNGKESEVDVGLTALDAMRYLEVARERSDQLLHESDRRLIAASHAQRSPSSCLALLEPALRAGWELWIPVATVLAAAFTTYPAIRKARNAHHLQSWPYRP
jgi:hypothetical protein